LAFGWTYVDSLIRRLLAITIVDLGVFGFRHARTQIFAHSCQVFNKRNIDRDELMIETEHFPLSCIEETLLHSGFELLDVLDFEQRL
jgi:hypothetical protein